VKGEKEEGEGKGDEDWGRQTGNNLAQVCVCVWFVVITGGKYDRPCSLGDFRDFRD
jgi:hypothetical protein